MLKVKESAVEVFALDYGCTMSVDMNEVYSLPEDLELLVCPQCASLCTVAGKDMLQLNLSCITPTPSNPYPCGGKIGVLASIWCS